MATDTSPAAPSSAIAPVFEPLATLAAWRDSQLITLRAESGSARADTVFLGIQRELWRRVGAVSDAILEDSVFQQAAVDSTGADSLDRLLAPAGVDLVLSEGTAYLEPNADSLASHVARFLSPGMREFVRLRARDQAQGFSEDAGLTISWQELAQRVADWDRFTETHPTLATDEPEYWYSTYLRTYLTGMDNSRIFIFEDSTLEPEVRRSYEWFLRRFPNTRAGKLLAGYLEALAADGYREGPAGRRFLGAAGVRTMLGVQPPVR